MLLKKIQIRGFKTFADNTEIVFTPGITAVVGPNGSGKSNISDAIQWVMGESNVRNLRAARTEDVIFNGSGKRKALGLAEVSLTLDNSTGRLPVGFDEVTITRRAFRSGDSEYFINKVPCRLRDIFELFLDSGAGRGAYSMVNQGEIDRMLTAKPEDRRELLEEAAGVKKYRHRRQETVRKLEHTETNLSRVADIMNELAIQVEPLADQAKQAIRYKELTSRLGEIEVGLLVSRVQQLESDINGWQAREQELNRQLEELEELIEGQAIDEENALARSRQAQQELEEAYQSFNRAQSEVDGLKGELAIAVARRESAEEGKRRINEELQRLGARLEEQSREMESHRVELEEVSRQKAELSMELEGLKPQQSELISQISRKEEALKQQEAGARGLAADRAAQQSRSESCQNRIRQLQLEAEQCQVRVAELVQRRQARSDEADAAASLVLSETVRANQLTQSAAQQQAECEEVQENLQEATLALEDLNRSLMEVSSRLKTLQELHDAREGFFAGVKAVMQASEKGALPKEYAVVADILEVPADLDQAVEAALGGALQDIATPTFDLAKRAIEYLRQMSTGRATFLPMDRLDRQNILSPDAFKGVSGIIGCAYDLIGYDGFYEPVARMLLGRVLVAEDIDSAGNAARSLKGWSKIVTPEGELLLPSGAITGGSRQRKGSGLTERKRELAELSTRQHELAAQQENAKDAVEALKAELKNATETLAATRSEAESARISLAQAVGARDAAQSSLRELEDAENQAQKTLEAARAQVSELELESAALEAMLSNTEEAGGALEEMLSRQHEELSALQITREQLNEEVGEVSNRLSAASERELSLKRLIDGLRQDDQRTRNLLASRRQELENLERQGAVTDEQLEEAAKRLKVAQANLAKAEQTLAVKQGNAKEMASLLAIASQGLKLSRTTRDQASDEMHKLQLSLTRGETEMVQSLERLWEDYEINKIDALTWPEPLLVKDGTASEVAKLRREIRLMGDVNTGAIAEYERVQERWDFLSGQKSDLEEAKEGLLQAIREIDESTRDLFLDTFNQVADHFETIFRSLFGGGAAKLELTMPSNLLDTGVEIFVQPPGKKLQNMNLLSGGEKALTAQAFLFALMRVRPSPFCVLDEVDAPLDDANVTRFATLVRQYAENSQFIVITHNRATMEAADCLYGVTMSEPGVSSVVSARLTE